MSTNQTARQESPVFSFRQQNPNCYYIGVTHAFPAHQTLPSDAPELTTAPSTALPAFNYDRHYFTPSFLLSTDRDYYRENLQFQEEKFQLKMQQAEAELSNHELVVVQPSPNFCQICRSSYQCYVQHIAERSHARALALRQSNKWILEACTGVQNWEKSANDEDRGISKKERGCEMQKKAGKKQPRGMTRVKKKAGGKKDGRE